MRKWIFVALVALVALVLLYVFRCSVEYGPPTICSAGERLENGFCMRPDGTGGTTGTGALCEEGIRDFRGKCVSTHAPRCPSGYVFETGGLFGTYKCITTAAAAKNRAYEAAEAAAAGTPDAPRGSTSSTSYTPIPVSVSGNLPPAIDASVGNTDSPASSSSTGSVFGIDGPFSGIPGTGQGSGANAAAGLTGNTYGSSGSTTTLNPYDMYPSGKPKAPPAGMNLPVKGPSSGGRGASAATSSTKSSQPSPTLSGPAGGGSQTGANGSMGWGHAQINSGDTSALPSDASAGSDPSNAYAATSRVPGDMDLFPNPYIQSTSYSLANGSQKTDPVPFLTDFSAFQN